MSKRKEQQEARRKRKAEEWAKNGQDSKYQRKKRAEAIRNLDDGGYGCEIGDQAPKA